MKVDETRRIFSHDPPTDPAVKKKTAKKKGKQQTFSFAAKKRHELSIDERFLEFHKANQKIYEQMVHLARHAMRHGKKRIGIGMLTERVRWDFWLESEDSSFKINNDYRSRYARLIMEQEHDLAGVFETRMIKTP